MTWLPDELTRAQPYSMGPLLRWASPRQVPQLQANPIRRMANPERDILTCLVAPRDIQMSARSEGVDAVIMIRPKGIEKFPDLQSRLRMDL
jgi:hypothetical protein